MTDVLTRVWQRTTIRGEYECWPCIAAPDQDGYARVKVDGKMVRAHRVVFAATHGTTAPDCVLHTCDNPPCVNPAHLVAGTNDDNVRDRVKKRRSAVNRAGAVLTELEVAAIRTAPESPGILAKVYGVDRKTIYRVRHGKTWRNVP